MPTTTLYLIRHGEADETTDDDPGLTELGRRQAEAVGARLRGLDLTVVHHSPRRRAIETATIVAEQIGSAAPAPSRSADDLTPFPDDWDLVPQGYHGWLREVPNEKRDPGARRLDKAIVELSRVEATDQSRVVITHNFVIGWFVRHALDAPWWRWMGLNQANGGLTVIAWRDGDPPRLLTFNECAHLCGL